MGEQGDGTEEEEDEDTERSGLGTMTTGPKKVNKGSRMKKQKVKVRATVKTKEQRTLVRRSRHRKWR